MATGQRNITSKDTPGNVKHVIDFRSSLCGLQAAMTPIEVKDYDNVSTTSGAPTPPGFVSPESEEPPLLLRGGMPTASSGPPQNEIPLTQASGSRLERSRQRKGIGTERQLQRHRLSSAGEQRLQAEEQGPGRC